MFNILQKNSENSCEYLYKNKSWLEWINLYTISVE